MIITDIEKVHSKQSYEAINILEGMMKLKEELLKSLPFVKETVESLHNLGVECPDKFKNLYYGLSTYNNFTFEKIESKIISIKATNGNVYKYPVEVFGFTVDTIDLCLLEEYREKSKKIQQYKNSKSAKNSS